MRMEHFRVSVAHAGLVGVDTIYAWRAPGAKALNLRFKWGKAWWNQEESWSPEVFIEPIPERFRGDIEGFLSHLYWTVSGSFRQIT